MLRTVLEWTPIAFVVLVAMRAGWHLNEMQSYRRGGMPEPKGRRLDDWFRVELYSETGQMHQARGLRLLKAAIGIILVYAASLMILYTDW
jgi:hypothetical protein